MHAKLFVNTSQLARPDLLARADSLGLDPERFARCLSGEATAAVKADIAEGDRLGVRGTPAFFVGVADGHENIRLVRRIDGGTEFEGIKSAVTISEPRQRWSLRRLFS